MKTGLPEITKNAIEARVVSGQKLKMLFEN